MSVNYPSRGRAKKAFWEGVKGVRRRRPNPYRNAKLAALYDRGFEFGTKTPDVQIPIQFLPKPKPVRQFPAQARGYRAADARTRGSVGRPGGFGHGFDSRSGFGRPEPRRDRDVRGDRRPRW